MVKLKNFCLETDSFQSNNIIIPDFFIGISGLANNSKYFKKMVLSGIQKNMFLSYPDHHNYSNQDIQRIKQDLKTRAGSAVITTRKDFYKIYKKLRHDLFILDVEHKIDDTLFGLLEYMSIFKNNLRGVLFDMDGTVLDSEGLFDKAQIQYLEENNFLFQKATFVILRVCHIKIFIPFS